MALCSWRNPHQLTLLVLLPRNSLVVPFAYLRKKSLVQPTDFRLRLELAPMRTHPAFNSVIVLGDYSSHSFCYRAHFNQKQVVNLRYGHLQRQ